MSQRGRGTGPHEDDLDGEDAEHERGADGLPRSPSQRPTAPYDPYRTGAGGTPRRAARNVAADAHDTPPGPAARRIDADPFLPDDDPLSADAWQLELDEVEVSEEDLTAPLPNPGREPRPPRRQRRQPPAMREGRVTVTGTGTRRAVRRSPAPAAGMRERLPRGAVSISVPRVVTGSSLFADQTALLLLAINGVSLLLMMILLGVRLGSLPNPTVLHLDAAGNPDRWGPPSVLWRLPLMAFFMTVMFTVVAWFLHPIDRFAARFALGAAAVAQLVAWVAVLQHLFAG